MVSRLLFGGALLQLAANSFGMSNLNSCSQQDACLDISIDLVDDTTIADFELDAMDPTCGETEGCFYIACIAINFERADCPKESSDSISHMCDKSDDTSFCPTSPARWDAVKEKVKPGNDGTQCQIGKAGTILDFLYKDSNGCSDDDPPITDEPVDGGSYSCRASGLEDRINDGGKTCTGNGIGVECIWQVQLPDNCPDDDGVICADYKDDNGVTLCDEGSSPNTDAADTTCFEGDICQDVCCSNDDVLPTTCPMNGDINADVTFPSTTSDGEDNVCLANGATVFAFDFGMYPSNADEIVILPADEYGVVPGTPLLVRTGDDSGTDIIFEDEVTINQTDGGEVYYGYAVFLEGAEDYCEPVLVSFTPDCDCNGMNENCPSGMICCTNKNKCDEFNAGDGADACGDPHMTGFLGQKFDFTGEDGEWYSLIADANMHINMRVTSPVPDVPEITYITGLSVLTTDASGFDHSVVIEVKDPHTMASSCPAGVSPCLADGSLSVTLDGEEALLAPGTVSLSPDVEVSAANLPGACRSFGFEKYWERKQIENAANGRRLGERLGMGDWILADPTATNMDECAEYVARAELIEDGLFAHQSEHASFQIVTPAATVRLSHGRLHQVATRDPTGQYDLPDHLTWQMNMAVEHTDVNRDAKGILGETFVPTRDANGHPIMTGMEAIRGTQEDYRVDGALGINFVQDAYTS